jgi:predicted AAA+ superfamily ATPase
MELHLFQRDITKKILNRANEERRFIQVVAGPRQVGKTTAVLQVLKQIECSSHYATADLPAPPHEGWISQQWELARSQLQSSPKVILVLDEVQKVSHWSETVKRLWDEDTRLGNNIHVLILGSSALLIHKGLSESLAGRFEVIRCSHWSFTECRDCFQWTLEKYIYFGGYPSAAQLAEDETRWADYVKDSLIETFISKDILLLNRVEKPALLRQLFVLACEYGGQILSYQKMLGQLADAGNTTTLAHYQSLFESAFVLQGLPKWSTGRIRVRKSSPKWLPLNTALMTALSNKSFVEWHSAPELWGRLVEVAVGAYIANQASEQQLGVYYWRKGNYEVDFVIQKGKQLLAVEVKSGQRKDHLDGLKLFLKENKNVKPLVVGLGGVDLKSFMETSVLHWFD